MSDLLDLKLHPFVEDAFDKAADVEKLLGNRRSPCQVVPEYAREPDEHEFFLIWVASALAEVLNCCEQLGEIPVLLTNHRQTLAMDKAGINRHSLIVYHLENYLIRTQSLLDRVLKLVNAVFHLLNDPRNCRYDVVIRNVKVQVSDIPESVRSLKRLLEKYSVVRNEIIHHHSINEDALRRLDLYFLIERRERIRPKEKPPNTGEFIKETISEIVSVKKRELVSFNEKIAPLVTSIFNKVAPYYAREEEALRLRLSKSDKA